MYKVLDVRENTLISGGSYRQNYGSTSGTIENHSRRYVVVICLNEETGKRERIVFSSAYEEKILWTTYYIGYTGDYDLLIPGDRFEIKKTSKYEHVNIIYK